VLRLSECIDHIPAYIFIDLLYIFMEEDCLEREKSIVIPGAHNESHAKRIFVDLFNKNSEKTEEKSVIGTRE